MQKISLVDETFDLNFTLEYKLSIQLSLDGFSFSILDTIQNKVIYLYHQELFETEPDFLLKRLKSIYEESDLLHLAFKKTCVIFAVPNRTTLVPDEIYQSQNTADYLKGTMMPAEGATVKATFISPVKYWAVYEIPQMVYRFLEEKHPGAKFMSDLNLSLPRVAGTKNLLKVTVLKKHLIVSGIDELGLHFHNSFFYDGENDVMFYILGSIKASASEPQTILLDGMVNKHATIYHRLKQYFTDVEIASNPKNIHYSYLFDKLPDARFVNLFNSFS
ncbi:DUF3822 family protein [Mangrovibacterium diazotrophicum]|uniref:Uncharacterized protein DUF3822 n=1 Tax=Mangrovibacterium diazotrophicum TaxID=1261403 RepID=A0A419W2I6_9BACT|nr:DUF3822 family protein [Mangrovibacterium diazotrophicum]RKD89692.1 uncharacterized protein DUF3822 [Mangrovibacterium diazotrophicum]